MDRDAFWTIIDRAYQASSGDPQRREKLLTAEVQSLSKADVQSFAQHFDDAMDEAYSHALWGAAYVIGGGCSDDAFSDFRSSLISRGRAAFEQALAAPDSLADQDLDEESWFYEGFAYVPTTAVKMVFGSSLPRARSYPAAPSGIEWAEDNLANLYPRLSRKYA